jgi:hypothetical protein
MGMRDVCEKSMKVIGEIMAVIESRNQKPKYRRNE